MRRRNSERWKQIPGYNYEVSNHGRVRNAKTLHVLKPMLTGAKHNQRMKVRLSTFPRVDFDVAHLVLAAFDKPRPKGEVAMHGDDNPKNNHILNLCWATVQDNARDMARKCRGGNQRLTPDTVDEIRKRRVSGERGRILALEYGISEQRVCDIYKGRTAL